MTSIHPRNLSAQLAYRGVGNPPVSHPATAISNCYPGLEFDFQNVWRRFFVGIELHEKDTWVVKTDQKYAHLLHHRLLSVNGERVYTVVTGPRTAMSDPAPLATPDNPQAVAALEWSNALANILATAQGKEAECVFTSEVSNQQRTLPPDGSATLRERLVVRHFFETTTSPTGKEVLPVVARELAQPGELGQGLCSPWQNDYRECACYYWAASRPDYVNVEPGRDGQSVGHNWMQKDRASSTEKKYILDNRKDTRLLTYEELFTGWEQALKFVIGGKDVE